MKDKSKQVFVSVTVFLFMMMVAITFSSAGEEMKVSFYYMEDEGGFKFVSPLQGNNYTWEFGDGTIAYGRETTHHYASNGIYEVNLTIKNDDGIIFESQMINTADSPPEANFYFSPEYPYTLQQVFFWDNSTDVDGYIINWTWHFGDGNISYGPFVNHTYLKAGNYTVQLTVVDNEMKADSVSQIVVVRNRPPVPKFYWTRLPDGELEFQANFHYDPSYDEDGIIVNYTWDMGDGNIKHGDVVHHSYVSSGEYTVTLTVRDDDNGVSSFSRKIHSNNGMPEVEFKWEPEEPTDLDNVTFLSESTDDGTIEKYIWEFGDGTISENQTVVHRYQDDGYYSVKLTLVDDEGAFNYSQKTIFIKNVPPVANFIYSPPYPIPNKKIVFNASSSYDLDGEIVEWRWDFGDGNTTTGMVVNHTYLEDGLYVVNLTVTDDDGTESYLNKTILLADIYVDENVFDPANKTWNKIQDAVDNASDGCFIYVRPGTYEENVYINKSVMIQGINAKVECTSCAFYLDAPDIIISNFSIYGGDCGVVFNSTGGILEDTDVKAKNNGIIFNGNQNTLTDVFVSSQNTSVIINSHFNLLTNSSFHGNIYGIIDHGGGNEMMKCHIAGGIYGIAIYAPNDLIEESHIEEAVYGIYLTDSANISNNTISDCSWGIKINSLSPVIIDYNWIGDCATAGVEGLTDFVVRDTEFYNNTVSISALSSVEVYNVSIYGGDTGIHMMDGNIESSIVDGCSAGIEVEGSAFINDTAVKNCGYGLKGDGRTEIYDAAFINNEKGIYNMECNVEGSRFLNNYYGVYGSNISVYNSSFEENNVAVCIWNFTIIYNNFFISNNGAVFVEGENNNILNNTLQENEYGIILEGKRNFVANNTISSSIYGMRLIFAPNNMIEHNTMENNTYNLDVEGSKVEHFYIAIDETNTINGKEVKYLINMSGFTLDEDYGYIALVNCNAGVVKNANISSNGEGIMVIESENVKIYNCTLVKNVKGIYALNGNNIEIENVVVRNNGDGISLKATNNVKIKNAKIDGNSRGLNLFFMERTATIYGLENLSFEKNVLALNIENMEGVSLKNSTFNENDKGVRAFNSDISLHSLIMGDEVALHFTSSSVELTDFDISASVAINADSSTVVAESGSIRNSSLGISGINSIFEMNNLHIYGNIEGVNVSNSEINMKDCNFSENGKNVFNSCDSELEKIKFENNNMAICVIKGDAVIQNSTFLSNDGGVFAENIALHAFNLTISGGKYGILLNSSFSIISGGELFNNTVGVEVHGDENIIQNLLLHHNSYAILLHGFNNTVKNNSIWKNLYGIMAYDKNLIYHNNFISNTEDARDYGENMWNMRYPIGGNYWDKYAGEDYLMGEGQNESGSDGIGDIPHQFYGNEDIYPLMDYYENASMMPNMAPEASFYFYPPSPTTFQNITFIDTSRDENGERDMVAWTWDFGDGNTSSERNPTHYYEKSGRYNVTLRVVDRGGMENITVKEIVISNLPPVAIFKFQPENPHSLTLIEFNASGSTDKDGSITNYTWNMGDGTTKSGVMITHKYSKPGTYEVTLTVVDDEGDESTYTATVKVDNRAPEANFVITPENPKEGEKINFTDLSSDLDGEIVEWRWDFGDGTISYNEDVVHVYNKPGEYTVTLEVRDNMGAKANYTMTIKIGSKEMPGFNFALLFASLLIMVALYRRLKKFK